MNAPAKLFTLDPPVEPHRLSLDDYERMADAGILTGESHVELIEGVIVDRAPIGSRHAGVVAQIDRIFSGQSASAIVWVQNPIRLGKYSEPEPDIAVLKPRKDFYKKSHPHADDVLLIIEVADTSIEYDRRIKVPLYAEHGVPEVWLVDLNLGQIEIYLEPSKDGFRKILRPQADIALSPTLVPEMTLVSQALFAD